MFSRRLGRHRTPRVCHPPPIPPIIPPPPPPPTCPPDPIGGWIDATAPWGSYYSPYTAARHGANGGSYYEHSNIANPGHRLIVDLDGPPGLLDIHLIIVDPDWTEQTFTKADVPFTWCQHFTITISNWDAPPDGPATCVFRLTW